MIKKTATTMAMLVVLFFCFLFGTLFCSWGCLWDRELVSIVIISALAGMTLILVWIIK